MNERMKAFPSAINYTNKLVWHLKIERNIIIIVIILLLEEF